MNTASLPPAGQAGRGPDHGIRGSPFLDPESLMRKIRELAKPRPIYTPQNAYAVHALRYDWTGWLSGDAAFPATTSRAIAEAAPLWKGDGLEMETFRAMRHKVQILFKTAPRVSPVFFNARVKGRLQHALRQAGTPVKFSRKVAFRSLGENIRDVVENYLRKQVRKEGFIDPRHVKRMHEFTVVRDRIDLSEPTTSLSGRYWYNLHVVMVVSGRRHIVAYSLLGRIRDGALRIADKKNYPLKSVSVMHDHVHMALRGDIAQSPEEMALCFMNNLAYMMGYNREWEARYYVGTFSEYGMDVIRRDSERG